MRPRLTSLPLILAALVAFVSGGARAQTGTPEVQPDQPLIQIASGSSSAFNQETCQTSEGGTAIVYSFPAGFSVGTKLTIFATDQKSCPEDPPDAATVLLNKTTLTTTNQSGTLRVVGVDLVPNCPANTNLDFLICAVTFIQTYDTTGRLQDSVAYNENVIVSYDSVQPDPPAIASTTAGDSAVTLEWKAQTDIDRWIIYYRKAGNAPPSDDDVCADLSSSSSGVVCAEGDAGCYNEVVCGEGDAGCVIPDDAGAPGADAASSDASPSFTNDGGVYASVTITDDGTGSISSGRVNGLVNNQQYEFVLVAVDLAGNVSAGSAPVTETPLTVHDFYRRFQCAGGNEKGGFGCSTAGMAILVPVAGLAAAALLRRRRTP